MTFSAFAISLAVAASPVSSLRRYADHHRWNVPYTLAGTELYANDTFDTNPRFAYKRMGAMTGTNLVLGPAGSSADAGLCIVSVFANVHPATPLDVAAVATLSATSVIRVELSSLWGSILLSGTRPQVQGIEVLWNAYLLNTTY